MRLRFALGFFALLTTPMISGCGDHDHEDHSPAEEACEHTAVRITLVADANDASQNSGFVTFEADEATEFGFFLSADVTMAITDASGTAVPIEESADVAACTQVAKQHNADLEVGTYTLQFGPTTETLVSLVVEELSHEGDAH